MQHFEVYGILFLLTAENVPNEVAKSKSQQAVDDANYQTSILKDSLLESATAAHYNGSSTLSGRNELLTSSLHDSTKLNQKNEFHYSPAPKIKFDARKNGSNVIAWRP